MWSNFKLANDFTAYGHDFINKISNECTITREYLEQIILEDKIFAVEDLKQAEAKIHTPQHKWQYQYINQLISKEKQTKTTMCLLRRGHLSTDMGKISLFHILAKSNLEKCITLASLQTIYQDLLRILMKSWTSLFAVKEIMEGNQTGLCLV